MLEEITLGALLVTAFGVMFQLVRQEAPKFFGAARESKRKDREATEQKLGEDRQDDVATFANMVSLQKRMSHQNEKLTDYFIMDFRQDVVDLKNAMSSLESQLTTDAKETNKRLQTSSLELNQVSTQQRIITSEMARLTDAIFEFDRKITYALSCIPDLLERDEATEEDASN